VRGVDHQRALQIPGAALYFRPGEGAPAPPIAARQGAISREMPWSERDARMWQIVFPNMANWLPEDEAEQLRFEFAREMERLRQAA
jgi:hypothetical protein